MFWEWVSAGAIIGIKVFFGVLTFAFCGFSVVAILGLVGKIFQAADGGDR